MALQINIINYNYINNSNEIYIFIIYLLVKNIFSTQWIEFTTSEYLPWFNTFTNTHNKLTGYSIADEWGNNYL